MAMPALLPELSRRETCLSGVTASVAVAVADVEVTGDWGCAYEVDSAVGVAVSANDVVSGA